MTFTTGQLRYARQHQAQISNELKQLAQGLECADAAHVYVWLEQKYREREHRFGEHVFLVDKLGKRDEYDQAFVQEIANKLRDEDGTWSQVKIETFCQTLRVLDLKVDDEIRALPYKYRFDVQRSEKRLLKNWLGRLEKSLRCLCPIRLVANLTDDTRATIIQGLDALEEGLEQEMPLSVFVWLEARYDALYNACYDEYDLLFSRLEEHQDPRLRKEAKNSVEAKEEAFDREIMRKLTRDEHGALSVTTLRSFYSTLYEVIDWDDERGCGETDGHSSGRADSLSSGLRRLALLCSRQCNQPESPLPQEFFTTPLTRARLDEAYREEAHLIDTLEALPSELENQDIVSVYIWLKRKCETFYRGHPDARAIEHFNEEILGKLTRRAGIPRVTAAVSFEKMLREIMLVFTLQDATRLKLMPFFEPRLEQSGFYRGLKALQHSCHGLFVRNQYVRNENRFGHDQLVYSPSGTHHRPTIVANGCERFAAMRGDNLKTAILNALADLLNEHSHDANIINSIRNSYEYHLLEERQCPLWAGTFFKKQTDSVVELERMFTQVFPAELQVSRV